MLDSIDRFISTLENIVVTVLMFSATVITIVQVAARYVFNNSIYWSEEFILYTLISMSFFTMSMGVRHATHIKVEVLYAFSNPSLVYYLHLIAAALGMLFSFALGYYGYFLASNTLRMGQLSPAMQVPMGLIYWVIPISSALMFVRYLCLAINILQGKDETVQN